MIALGNIANFAIRPDTIIVQRLIEEVSDSLLAEFKDYIGIDHNTEDDRLKRSLLSIFREIARPTSLGLSMNVGIWEMDVILAGRRYAYLPRYNGMNLSSRDYDESGNLVTATWAAVAPHLAIGNIAIVEIEADPLPAKTRFTWTVGFNESDFPDPVKEMAFMQAGFLREYPFGVDERGQSVPAMPDAIELVRAEWQMRTDLSALYGVGNAPYRTNYTYWV